MDYERLNIVLEKVVIYYEFKVCFFIFDISDLFDGRVCIVNVYYEYM